MLDAISRTRGALAAAHQLSVRAQTAVGGYRLAARLLALLLAAMAFDLFFPLPNLLRGLWMAGLAAWAVYRVRTIRGQRRAEAVRLERAAMLLEEKHPELENALINAVQFSAEVAAHPDDPSAPLMRREMARAERASVHLPIEDAADLAAVARARKGLLTVAGVLLLTLLLFPRAYRFEVPRFFAFWADHPPFTLTDFLLSPKGVHVKVGGSVKINVRFGGLTPDSVTLVTRTGPQPERSTPLFAADGGLYTQILENLTEDTLYYVRANTGRSARYRIQVDQAPQVKSVSVTLHPPAYAKRRAETTKLGDEGIGGLYGTQVDVEVEATRPLESGRLRLTYSDAPGETVALAPLPGKPGQVGGRFTIKRGGRFRLDLTAADGLATLDAAHGELHLLRDEKPLVYITAPGQNAIVTPEMAVPIKAEAEDDVGIQRIEMHRIVNNMADSAQTFPIAPGQRRADAILPMNFQDLGVRPGDVIQYYATAYDNDPGKPHLTDSERYWLWVVSEEDYRKILQKQRGLPQLAEQYRAQTDALKSLAAAQRALADQMAKLRAQAAQRPNDPTTQQQRKALQKAQSDLRKEAQDVARAMRKLAAEKPQYDIEKGLQKKMSELAKQIEQAERGAMKGAESAPSPAQMAPQGEQAARQLEKASGQGQQSVEKALQALEKLAPLYQDVAALKRLAERQGEMAMQARQTARQVKQDEFSKARMKELTERQAQTRQELSQLQQDIQEHAQACQSVAPNAAQQAEQVARALESMRVADTMQSAADAFREQDSQTGAGHAERARRALESLFQKGQQAQGGAKKGLDSQAGLCLGQGAGDTLEQLSRNRGQGGQNGQGRGVAQGQSGNPAPQPGSRPGDGWQQGGSSPQQAMAMTLRQQQQGRSTKRENRRHFPGADLPGELGKQDVERLADASRKPSPAADPAAGRYPAEYRRLVKDYFKAVAGGK